MLRRAAACSSRASRRSSSDQALGAEAALTWRALVALGLVATVARTFNLGTFSLWLDEILLVVRAAQGSPAAIWAACVRNAEHPPLAALALGALVAMGASDVVLRLLPIALGVASVLILASFTSRRFGQPAGIATGLIAALSPFHVRYSQELRPYAFLVLFVCLTLAAGERLERRGSAGDVALLFAALLGGFYSHHLFVLVLVPAAWPLAEAAASADPVLRRKARAALVRFAVAVAAALLALLPWLLAIAPELAGRAPSGGALPWTGARLLARWQFLAAGGVEGNGLRWSGVLALALVVVGAAAAARNTAGRAVIAGALAGIGGAELFYALTGHFSRGRYDAVGWPFLPVLIALALTLALPPRASSVAANGARDPRVVWRRVAAVLLFAALIAGEVSGLVRYARRGRPDWDRVAETVRALRRPGEPVLVENEWTRISLGYYLQGRDFLDRTAEDGAPHVVKWGASGLLAEWPADRRAVLVIAGHPAQKALRSLAQQLPAMERSRRAQARVFLLTPDVRQRLAARDAVERR